MEQHLEPRSMDAVPETLNSSINEAETEHLPGIIKWETRLPGGNLVYVRMYEDDRLVHAGPELLGSGNALTSSHTLIASDCVCVEALTHHGLNYLPHISMPSGLSGVAQIEVEGILTFDQIKDLVRASQKIMNYESMPTSSIARSVHFRTNAYMQASPASFFSATSSYNSPAPFVGRSSIHASPASSSYYSPASFVGHAYMNASPASFYSAASNFSSPASFMTAPSPQGISSISQGRATSAISGMPSIHEACEPTNARPTVGKSEYRTLLEAKDLLQPWDKELNWSGKGQHVEFDKGEEIPLTMITHLGSSLTASVDKVRCRRILLARKTMRCTYKWKISDALGEVEHLNRLKHRHIIQLVGTYLEGRNFSILMYPAADCHLGTFLEDTADVFQREQYRSVLEDMFDGYRRAAFLTKSFGCLASTLAFIHSKTTKHMDIKPANILVRYVRPHTEKQLLGETWRIYVADFGLSRSFVSEDHSQSEGPTSRTPKYCAPEVYDFDKRGRSADIFSLGCVYSEIQTVLSRRTVEEFANFRRARGVDETFHRNSKAVSTWLRSLRLSRLGQVRGPYSIPTPRKPLTEKIEAMMSENPADRPTAADLESFLQNSNYMPLLPPSCCNRGPEQYVVDPSLSQIN